MAHIEGEILIGRQVEEVFDFVADGRNEPRYNTRMARAEKLSPGPIGPGTRVRSEFSSPGRPVAMTELTGYDRPRRLDSTTAMSMMHVQGTLIFEPLPDGTRMRWSWQIEPRGLYRLLGPAIALIGRRQEAQTWDGLKRFLEEHRDAAER